MASIKTTPKIIDKSHVLYYKTLQHIQWVIWELSGRIRDLEFYKDSEILTLKHKKDINLIYESNKSFFPFAHLHCDIPCDVEDLKLIEDFVKYETFKS